MSNIKIRDATIGFLAGAILTLGGVKLCGRFLKGKGGKDSKLPSMGFVSVIRIGVRFSSFFDTLTSQITGNRNNQFCGDRGLLRCESPPSKITISPRNAEKGKVVEGGVS